MYVYICIVLIQATRPIRKKAKSTADRWTDRQANYIYKLQANQKTHIKPIKTDN